MTPQSILDRIPMEKFMAVYNKYAPNAWTKFSFRYFSTDKAEKDKWLSKTIRIVLIILFLLGFIGTLIKPNSFFVGCVTIPFFLILFAVGIIMGGAAIMNNFRIRKIRKELGVTKQEYEFLSNVYMS